MLSFRFGRLLARGFRREARRSIRRRGIHSAAVAASIAVPALSFAADVQWSNPAGGSFQAGSNWTGGSPPSSNDIADFKVPGTTPYAVSLSADAQTSQLTVAGSPVGFNLAGHQYTVDTHGMLFGPPNALSVSGSLAVAGGTFQTPEVDSVSGQGALLTLSGPNTLMTGYGFAIASGGELDLSSGATLTTAFQTQVGSAGSGTVRITDPGSVWNYNSGNSTLTIASAPSSSGTLLITSGGRLQSTVGGIGIGWNINAIGSATLDGVDGTTRSTMAGASGVVGYAGTGMLTISNGALLSDTGNFYISNEKGSSGTVTVGGAQGGFNAEFNVSGTVFLADNESSTSYTGSLTINNGGKATVGSVLIGNAGGSFGTLTVSGGSLTTPGVTLRSGAINLSSGSIACTGSEAVGLTNFGFNVTFSQSGGTNSAGQITVQHAVNAISSYNLSGGTVHASVINNDHFNYSGGSLTGNVTNNSTGVFTVTGGAPLTLAGSVTNAGTFHVTGTPFTVVGTFTNNGAYISDPSDNQFSTLAVGATGYLAASAGDRFLISGDLTSSSGNNTTWNTSLAQLEFQAGASNSHNLYVTGAEDRATPAGYDNNFAWGALTLDSGQSLTLWDGNLVGGGGFYVGVLSLADGLGQMNSINLNGVNLYYNPSLPQNDYLGDRTYHLAGGGSIIPVPGLPAPEPSSLTFAALAGLGLLARRRPSSITISTGS
jgi:hypothetical protein